MAKKKKLTRKQKIELSKNSVCWKCNGRIEFDKEIRSLKCDNCGIIIDVKNKIRL